MGEVLLAICTAIAGICFVGAIVTFMIWLFLFDSHNNSKRL